jgi:hypothetical protein
MIADSFRRAAMQNHPILRVKTGTPLRETKLPMRVTSSQGKTSTRRAGAIARFAKTKFKNPRAPALFVERLLLPCDKSLARSTAWPILKRNFTPHAATAPD